MNLTDEQLEAIEEFAHFFLDPKEIAYIIEVDEIQFLKEMENPSSEAHRRYYKGYLSEKARQRKAIQELAAGGSAPAQAMVKAYMDELKVNL